MSTIAIIAIVIGALIVLALLISMARKAGRKRQYAQVQTDAKRDDAVHHREQAEERRTEAAVAEARARRAKVEAELDEVRAASRERVVGGS
jgi:FtsZ-interacting cell division protein ZipA